MDGTISKFKQEIQEMMYIAGETEEPSADTVALIESIIRDQVVLMLTVANDFAARRGSRLFSNNDLIFQFRHDDARIGRLKNFLAWKSIRKTVKEAEDDKGDLAEIEASSILGNTTADDPLLDSLGRRMRAPLVTLPWDTESFYSEEVPGDFFDEEESIDQKLLDRLRKADDRTRNMTVDEYATWSSYRHASFTYRKVKRFREWSGLGVIAEHKPNDDSLDILGFLGREMVHKLTEVALSIQKREMQLYQGNGGGETAHSMSMAPPKEGFFERQDATRPPIGTEHVRLAFQVLQAVPKQKRAMHTGTGFPTVHGLPLRPI